MSVPYKEGPYEGTAEMLNGYDETLEKPNQVGYFARYDIFVILSAGDNSFVYSDILYDGFGYIIHGPPPGFGEWGTTGLYGWDPNWIGWHGNLSLAQAIPEPSTSLLALSGLALLFRRRRK